MIKHDFTVPSYGGEVSIGAWSNDKIVVGAFKDGDSIRLDIANKDLSGVFSWEDLQEIKSQCGYGNYDAVEYYPADIDVINTANIRHLYVFTHKLPLIKRLNDGTAKRD